MPESVARTITPTVTSRIVATTVRRDSFWKRVTAGASSSAGDGVRAAWRATRGGRDHSTRPRPSARASDLPESALLRAPGYALHMPRIRLALLLVTALLVVACGSSVGAGPGGSSATAEVPGATASGQQ